MQSNYPRIYSLSTLGIIYHFNTDYPFHPFRTDFSGDGGSGKTMIADIIQLILVGPGVYESATEGNDDRPIEEIVLKPKNQKYGAGYVWLNIEKSPGRYIVIGAFIEKSSKQVKMFIGQAGFNWDNNLEPLSKPIYYNDLLINGKIVPVEEIQDKVQNIHIKTFPVKQYHRILYNNDILQFDLSPDNKKTLESYASIFRSFSRGSGFKKDPKNLKTFLFGDEDKNLLTKYNEEIKSINDDYKEHDRYKKEIDLINKKQEFIKDIVVLQNKSNTLQKQYITEKAQYWHGKQKQFENEYEKVLGIYNKSRIECQLLNTLEADFKCKEFKAKTADYNTSKKALEDISTKKESFLEEKKNKYERLQETEEALTNIKLIEKWLKKNTNSLEQVKQRYEEEVIYKQNKGLLDEFSLYIRNKQLTESFEKSTWISDFSDTKNTYEIELRKATVNLEELKALIVFSDLQNPDSLAKWAINYFKRPLNKEEESVLRYFQLLPRSQQKLIAAENRYLPFPEELFQNLDIKDSNKKGFWLNLDGVYEFVQYVPKQYLNISEQKKNDLIKILAKLTGDLKEEINLASKAMEGMEMLKKALFDFPGVENAISLYSKKSEFIRPWDIEFTNLGTEQFNMYLNQYKSKKQSINDHKIAKEAYEEIIRKENSGDSEKHKKQLKDTQSYFSDLEINLTEIGSHIKILESNLDEQEKHLSLLQTELGVKDAEILKIKSNLFKGKINYQLVLQLKASQSQTYLTNELEHNEALGKWNDAKEKNQKALVDYQIAFKQKIPVEQLRILILADPDAGNDSPKSKSEKASLEFQAKYDIVAKEMDEGAQLVGTYHVGQLAHKLLPSVFVTPKEVDEAYVNTQLTERLTKLYRTIREIGSRKIEILKRVFTEVSKTYREYLVKVNKIDNYFGNPNKKITGGNKGSLKYVLLTDYPAKWMTVFGRILDDQLPNTGLFQQLADEIDINEMMIKAFISEGGTKDADIEDLLDPKSYFDLEFELKLENGDNNAGSNSQTYSGNALLGLARLSLLDDAKDTGIRIMPIDEAQSLGSNYEMLRNIAIEEGYQILTMSIETAGEIRDGEQHIYILSENKLLDEDNYVPAMGIFNDGPITPNIEGFVHASNN